MPDLAEHPTCRPLPILRPRDEWTDAERERFDAAVANMAAVFEQIKAAFTELARQFVLAWPNIARALRYLAHIQRTSRAPSPHLARPVSLGRRGQLYAHRHH